VTSENNPTEPMPYVVVARISQDPGQTLTGVRRQVRQQIERVKDKPGYVLLDIPGGPVKDDKGNLTGERWPNGVLVDNNIKADSGDTEQRDRVGPLIAAGQLRVIVAMAFDRIWRPGLRELADAQDVLMSHDPPCILDLERDGVIHPDRDELVMTIKGAVARNEVKTISFRERSKFRDLANGDENPLRNGGTAHGARPFGYQLAHFEPGGGVHLAERTEAGYCPACQGRKPGPWRTYLADEAEAELLRQAARRVDESPAGNVLYSIICEWDGAGIRTAQGKSWRKAGTGSLKAALISPRNIGLRRHSPGWHERLGPGKGRRNVRPEGQLHKANWPAIFDGRTVDGVTYGEDLYYRVAEKLTRPDRNMSGGVNQVRHLLAGMCVCGNLIVRDERGEIVRDEDGKPVKGDVMEPCGARMKTHVMPRGPRYVCSTVDTSGCGTVVRRASDVEAEVTRVVIRWLARNGLYDQAVKAAAGEDVRALWQRQDDLQAAQERLDDDYYQAGATMTRARYERQCARIERDLAEVSAALEKTVRQDVMGKVPERGQAFARKWDQWGREGRSGFLKRREVLSVLIDKVVIHPSGRVGSLAPDPRLIQIYPGEWHTGLADPARAWPPAPPRPEELTSPAMVRAWLAAQPAGQWVTRADIAEGTGLAPGRVHKSLQRLCASGAVDREWAPWGADGDQVVIGASAGYRRVVPGGRAAMRARKARELRESGASYQDIAGTLGCSTSTAHRLANSSEGPDGKACFVYKIAADAESAA